ELRVDESQTLFGVGIDADTTAASLRAIVSGVERALGQGQARRAPTAQSEVAAA
ncbi:alpha-isopropylmalate synthase regulatory domain-containing protein, partial [uncultured Variovorax sp.]|uniref:alpha-isopropylmalate synthase regulatory domain-containing protein n=1 Tax=uncultured Variovorax sp. TaxID=114708 RepID=UPI0025E84F3F